MNGQKLERERITFDGKVQHCESVSEEIKNDIELFRATHEELVANMNSVQVFLRIAHSAWAHVHFRMPHARFSGDMTTSWFHILTL